MAEKKGQSDKIKELTNRLEAGIKGWEPSGVYSDRGASLRSCSVWLVVREPGNLPCLLYTSMGIANFKRDRKKTVAIVASLSLGGIILLVVSSMVLLRSPEALARQLFPDGDYKIYLDSEMTEEKVMAAGNPLVSPKCMNEAQKAPCGNQD